MQLGGKDGAEITLDIVGYQFQEVDDQYDANWLLIDITAALNGRKWSSQDACLLTWEANGLANWLDHVAEGNGDDEIDFLEPNLRFSVAGRSAGVVGFRVHFEAECRPPWARRDGADMDDLWIDLEIMSDDLRAAASSVRRGLERFPYRGSGECPSYPMG